MSATFYTSVEKVSVVICPFHSLFLNSYKFGHTFCRVFVLRISIGLCNILEMIFSLFSLYVYLISIDIISRNYLLLLEKKTIK